MQRPRLILYTRTGCLFCQRYRTILADHNVPFEERNTTENPRYLDELAALGIYLVPTAVVDGRVIPGFRPNTVLALMGVRIAAVM